jgi:DNA-binding MarR family transcriptional regulator
MAPMDGGENADNMEPGGDGGEVRWLTPKERRAWLSIVATHMQLMPALEADLQREGPVSFFEYQVLAMLSENDGPLPMSELAARTNASLSRLSHVARKLEARAWIRRRPSTEDARVTLAEMTERGMAEVVRIAPHHVASVRACLLDVLDDEDLEDIGRIGAKILGHLEPGHWVFRDPVLTAAGLTPS